MTKTVLKVSQKLTETGTKTKLQGIYFQEEANAKGLVLLSVKQADIKIFWLIEPDERKIVGAKYFSYGGDESHAIGEALCSRVNGLSVEEAFSITGDDIEKDLRDDRDTPSGPGEIFEAVDRILALAREEFPGALAQFTAFTHFRNDGGGPSRRGTEDNDEWYRLAKDEQMKKVDTSLDGFIRDYLRDEGGDVEIIDIIDGRDVYVDYKGVCDSCVASTGSTLLVIENYLREKVHGELNVIPTNSL